MNFSLKMMIALTAFALILSGVFSQAVAANDTPAEDSTHGKAGAKEGAAVSGERTGHADGSADAEGAGPVSGHADAHAKTPDAHHHSIGEPQPQADKTKATRPGMTTLVEPKALAKVSSTVTLKWTPAQGADVYHVQVAKDPRFKWFVVNEHNVTGDSFQTPALEPGPYFWRVAGRKPSNDPTWTKGFFSTSSFEVK